jgi:hypothetical protein
MTIIKNKDVLEKGNYVRERENGAPKSNVLASRSPVANPNLALIIQYLSRNNICSVLRTA